MGILKLSQPDVQETTRPKTGWFRAFQDLKFEHGYDPLLVDGIIPKDISGTLFRVGVGQYTAFGKPLPHWFDGNGAILGVRIYDGQASGAAKLIRTKEHLIEQKEGRHVFGSYGISPSSLIKRLLGKYRNAANTSVMSWNNRLFALWEAGLPTEISPSDLSTLGECSFNGVVKGPFSAHPRYVPSRKSHYNFGVRYTPYPQIDLYELSDSGDVKCLGSLPFKFKSMVHDFVVTEKYIVILAAPIFINTWNMLIKGVPVGQSLNWKESAGTEVIVISIDEPKKYWTIKTDSFLPTHYFNGFDRNGDIVLDGVVYPDFTSIERINQFAAGVIYPINAAKIMRISINIERRTIASAVISSAMCETPQVSPSCLSKEYQWGYAISYSTYEARNLVYFDALSKINMSTGEEESITFGEGCYPSEPIFVPKTELTSEDDGYILTLVYNSQQHRNYIAILDAKNFKGPPLAKIYLKGFFPLTFHGLWSGNSL